MGGSSLREGVSALDLGLLVSMYLLTMTGIELGFHRYYAHRTFETTRPLRALLLILGSMAGQGSALLWSGIHRWHHAHTDVPGDLHSPTLGRHGAWQRVRGFLWAQFLWYLDSPAVLNFRRFLERHRHAPESALASTEDSQESRLARVLPDLCATKAAPAQPALRALGAAGPGASYRGGRAGDGLVGGRVAGAGVGRLRPLLAGAAGLLRHQLGDAHGGHPARSTRDGSRNNAVMAVLTLGAGWHNNHHAFPGSAFTDFRWWQVDASGLMIRLLARLGWAWDVRKPSAEALAARART